MSKSGRTPRIVDGGGGDVEASVGAEKDECPQIVVYFYLFMGKVKTKLQKRKNLKTRTFSGW
jgi:hypothetical protein